MGEIVDVEVVDGPVLEAAAVAQAQGRLAQAEVGAQIVDHVKTVAPPAQMGDILVVAQVDLVVALVILGCEECARHGQLHLVAQGDGLASQAGVEPGHAVAPTLAWARTVTGLLLLTAS